MLLRCTHLVVMRSDGITDDVTGMWKKEEIVGTPVVISVSPGPFVLGCTADSDVLLGAPVAGRRHARIDWCEGAPWIFGSGHSSGASPRVNGTFVGPSGRRLHGGDLIELHLESYSEYEPLASRVAAFEVDVGEMIEMKEGEDDLARMSAAKRLRDAVALAQRTTQGASSLPETLLSVRSSEAVHNIERSQSQFLERVLRPWVDAVFADRPELRSAALFLGDSAHQVLFSVNAKVDCNAWFTFTEELAKEADRYASVLAGGVGIAAGSYEAPRSIEEYLIDYCRRRGGDPVNRSCPYDIPRDLTRWDYDFARSRFGTSPAAMRGLAARLRRDSAEIDLTPARCFSNAREPSYIEELSPLESNYERLRLLDGLASHVRNLFDGEPLGELIVLSVSESPHGQVLPRLEMFHSWTADGAPHSIHPLAELAPRTSAAFRGLTRASASTWSHAATFIRELDRPKCLALSEMPRPHLDGMRRL